MTLAVPPALSGCRPDSPTVDSRTEDAGQADAPEKPEPTGRTETTERTQRTERAVRPPAPPEQPELAGELFNVILAADEQAAIELVERGAPVNAVNERGVSVLHFAARATMPELTRRLLEYGADVDVALNDGLQPIHWAARAGANDREGAEETIDILLEYGADINARGDDGTLPIAYAIRLANERWMQFMISRGSLPR